MNEKIIKNHTKLKLKTKKLVNTLFTWNYKTAFKWRGLEFSDFREYEEGDDVKFIDFLVSAREWKTMIKLYREERLLNIYFLLDAWENMLFSSGDNSKLELMLETFYALSFSAIKNSDLVWSIIFDEKQSKFLRAKKGESSIINIHNELIKISSKSKSNSDINNAFKTLNNLSIKNSLVFVLSDKLDIDEKLIKLTSLKNTLVYINIFDSFENTLDSDSSFNFVSNNSSLFLSSSETKRKKYINLRNEKIAKLKKTLFKNNSSYLLIDENKNIIKELFSLFKSLEG